MKRSISFIALFACVLSQFFIITKADDNFGLSNSLVEYLEREHNIKKPITQRKLDRVYELETNAVRFENSTVVEDEKVMKSYTITDYTGVEKLRNLNEILIAIDEEGMIPNLPLNTFKKLESINFTLKIPDFGDDIFADEAIEKFNAIVNEILHDKKRSQALKDTIINTLNSITIESIDPDEETILFIELIDLSFYDRSFLKNLSFATFIPYLRFWDWNSDKYYRAPLERIQYEDSFAYRLELENPSTFIYSEGSSEFEAGESFEGLKSHININPANSDWIESIILKIEYETLSGDYVEFKNNSERIEFKKIIVYLSEKELKNDETIDRLLSIETVYDKKLYHGNPDLEYAMEDEYYISLGGPEKLYTVAFKTDSDFEIDVIENITRFTTIKPPETPSQSGYTFKGWYLEESFENEFDFSIDTVSENLILYAKWEKNKVDVLIQTPNEEEQKTEEPKIKETKDDELKNMPINTVSPKDEHHDHDHHDHEHCGHDHSMFDYDYRHPDSYQKTLPNTGRSKSLNLTSIPIMLMGCVLIYLDRKYKKQ